VRSQDADANELETAKSRARTCEKDCVLFPLSQIFRPKVLIAGLIIIPPSVLGLTQVLLYTGINFFTRAASSFANMGRWHFLQSGHYTRS